MTAHHLKSFVWLGLLLAVTVLLSACQKQQPPLKVGSNIWPGYESLYVARSQGFFPDDQVSLVEKVNATQVLRSFKAGQLDVAALTLDEALSLLTAVPDLRIIAVMDFSEGADVLMAKPEIGSLRALAGKTLLVEKTAVGAIMLQATLNQAGLTIDQIQVRNAGVNQHPDLWSDPDIAAAVTFEPYKSLLQQKGARVLFDSARAPGLISDVLVVRAATAEQRPEQLRTLLAGHFAALAFMQDKPLEAARIMSERLGVEPSRVWDSFAGLHIPDLAENHALLQGDGFLDQVARLKQLMLTGGLLNEDVALSSDLLSHRFLPEQTP